MITEFVQQQGEIAQLDICAEECAELIHAISKYKRAKGLGYETTVSEGPARTNLIEALAHSINAIRGVILLEEVKSRSVLSETYYSDLRALNRLMTPKEQDTWEKENKCLVRLFLAECDGDKK